MNAVAETLAAIARAAGRKVVPTDSLASWHDVREGDLAVFVYSRDFQRLWGLGNDVKGLQGVADSLISSIGDGELTLLIVWDGLLPASADPIEVSSYVTPYDWALALSVTLYRKESAPKSGGKPHLRILVLDLASRHQANELFTQKAFFAFHNVFPWVQVYRLIAATGADSIARADAVIDDCRVYAQVRQAIPPTSCDADRLIRDLRRHDCVLATFPPNDIDRLGHIEAVVESWRQQFLRAGERHSVSNLVAPFILAAGLPDRVREDAVRLVSQGSKLRRALWEVLKVVGIVKPAKAPEDQNEGIQARTPVPQNKSVPASNESDERVIKSDPGIFGRRTNVRFLLIDDQYSLGYQHILGYTLFGNEYRGGEAVEKDGEWRFSRNGMATLTCLPKIGPILEVLKTSPPVEDWSLPRVLKLTDGDILLLDLRLWSDSRDAGSRKEIMQDIVNVCSKLGTDKISDPSFKRAYDAAKSLVNDDNGSEIPALALLPLLLSHYDRSLPIVLFSSTHQRKVLELVAHRPNIVTIFSKPVLSGYGDDQQPDDFIADLQRALRKALDLHEARTVWVRLPSMHWNGNPAFSVRIGGVENMYNYPYFKGNVRQSSKPWKSTIEDNNLKQILADCYVRYLQKESYYDFVSVPYEFTEGWLTPAGSDPDSGFRLVDNDKKNKMGRVLMFLRHQKVHGHAQCPHDKSTQEEWRQATILQFLIWLDWIEESNTSGGDSLKDQLCKLQQDYWNYLTTYHGETLGTLDISSPPGLRDFAAHYNNQRWIVFVTYVAISSMCSSYWVKSSKACCSSLIIQALKRLYEQAHTESLMLATPNEQNKSSFSAPPQAAKQ